MEDFELESRKIELSENITYVDMTPEELVFISIYEIEEVKYLPF